MNLLTFFKKYGVLLASCGLGLFFVPDIETLQVTLFRFGIISAIMLLWLNIIGLNKDTGIFPDVDLKELFDKACESGIGAGIALFGLLIMLSTIIFCISK